jgi:putative transposase
MRHQVPILNRGRKRAPNLRASDRIIAGLCTLMMGQARVLRSAIVLKPSTLLHFHKMLTTQKYRLLFSPKRVRRPGPKGPTKELIDAAGKRKEGEQVAEGSAVAMNRSNSQGAKGPSCFVVSLAMMGGRGV